MPVPEERRLVCIGRFNEQKGHFLLLEAARCLRDRGVYFRLILVGDGELRGEIESRIAALGLTQVVELTGYLSEAGIQGELDRARALVLPSFAEGLPVVIMEAMAAGRPVLSTFVAGIPELVVPGRNGWLVPAGSVERLAEAMGEVLECPAAELAELGRVARRDVAARHDVHASAKRLQELFASEG
jgi:glycosyltransferase involved in cell wall biosynthesis